MSTESKAKKDSKTAAKPREPIPEPAQSRLIAKKDFEICHNDVLIKIKAGDDVSQVPEMFHQNLRTEGII